MKAIFGIFIAHLCCIAGANLLNQPPALEYLMKLEVQNSLSDLFNEWSSFLELHKKIYKNPYENEIRLRIFAHNIRKIEEHNQLYKLGKVTYKLKMNEFGDLSTSEFNLLMNGIKANAVFNNNDYKNYTYNKDEKLNETVDWRNLGAVTPVKNQLACGSCWAFSATGALEGQNFLKTGKLVSLSEQNLIDCSGKYGNDGCNGGLPEQAFKYILYNDGIMTESDYPYLATDGICTYDASFAAAKDSGYVAIQYGDEKALKNAVAKIGPISVLVDATDFQFYSSGIFNYQNCSSSDINHAVLAVGYGTDEGQDYWLIKNSWGEDWGEKGYLKMSRNKDNQCAIASYPTFPYI